MTNIKGTKTEANLRAAAMAKSQTSNEYLYFAKRARGEGYHYIADILESTAVFVRQHAKDAYKKYHGINDTAANLEEIIRREKEECAKVYPEYVKTAKEEGLDEIAVLLDEMAKVNKAHEERLSGLLDRIANGTVFKRDKPIKWRCLKCGYIHEGIEPPDMCPACYHACKFFEPIE